MPGVPVGSLRSWAPLRRELTAVPCRISALKVARVRITIYFNWAPSLAPDYRSCDRAAIKRGSTTQPISNEERKVNVQRAYDNADIWTTWSRPRWVTQIAGNRDVSARRWSVGRHDHVSCASNEPSAKETILISGQRPRTRGRALKPRGLSELNWLSRCPNSIQNRMIRQDGGLRSH